MSCVRKKSPVLNLRLDVIKTVLKNFICPVLQKNSRSSYLVNRRGGTYFGSVSALTMSFFFGREDKNGQFFIE